MPTLNTRIQLRHDVKANWDNNSTVVLKAGEVGIETDTSKMKVGDGIKTWNELKYAGGDAAQNFDVVPENEETDVAAITRVVGAAELHVGDTAIVKRVIFSTNV